MRDPFEIGDAQDRGLKTIGQNHTRGPTKPPVVQKIGEYRCFISFTDS